MSVTEDDDQNVDRDFRLLNSNKVSNIVVVEVKFKVDGTKNWKWMVPKVNGLAEI